MHTTTTTPTNHASRPPAGGSGADDASGDGPTARADRPTLRSPRRRRVRTLGLVLATTSALAAFGGFAGPARAETPPAPDAAPPLAIPAPSPIIDLPLAEPPPGPNHRQVSAITSKAGDTFADITFRSSSPTVIVQFSKTKPYTVDGKPTVGPVAPVALTGTPVPGNIHALQAEKQYQFKFSPQGLTPHTTYYILYTIHGAKVGQQPNYNSSIVVTKTRYVRATPLSIHVSDDADHGLRGDGEIAFSSRVAPEGNPLGYSNWAKWTKEHKLGSGDDLDVSKAGLGQTVATTSNTAVVQVQGRENDVDPGNYCAIEGGDAKPEQYSDECYEWSYAEATAKLPTGPYVGAHQQVVEAKVSRSPSLIFQAQVLVETWYA